METCCVHARWSTGTSGRLGCVFSLTFVLHMHDKQRCVLHVWAQRVRLRKWRLVNLWVMRQLV
jgi:hypothetical protein